MKVLVTGGAGYIGSHTCVELLAAGHEVVVIDNLSNSKAAALERVQEISARSLRFVHGDLRDTALLERLFGEQRIDAVVHFAGLKAVGESSEIPLAYYDNNIGGTLRLCQAMASAGVKRLVFSSSATVYGDPASVPIREDFPLAATNPYGRTKLFIEWILRDLQRAEPDWDIALLRYFNPVGAHASGRIGEDPNGIPNNLMPFVAQVAIGKREALQVFGDDYPTPDGTGVRDYIHVVDLALGHLAALEALSDSPGLITCNLGTGRGYSVLEMVRAFEAASGCQIPYRIVGRRPGDIAACYADPSYARERLGWQAERGLEQMVADVWRWQQQNPDGYPEAPSPDAPGPHAPSKP
ncbi:MAG: UDP-glucose 4-epimerase GalE [Gammaproteobacteria bacterium]|jgi:UDP-glucose 4-epimerase|nr:UDP-glucose 4-epimerase GalE [Gammaproteobacteria bacterium]